LVALATNGSIRPLILVTTMLAASAGGCRMYLLFDVSATQKRSLTWSSSLELCGGIGYLYPRLLQAALLSPDNAAILI